MGKRKPPKISRSTKSVPTAQLGSVHRLLHLGEDEARDAYQAAKKARKVYGPMHLLDAWWRLRYNYSLPGFVADLRDLIKDRDLDDPSLVAGHLARFIELMVVRFERLVEAGQFDSALPRLTALPMLYSPRAGKGAPEWEKAKTLYKEKKVGSEALLNYRGRDPQTARNPVWGEKAKKVIGIKMATVFKESQMIGLDGFTVMRTESTRDRDSDDGGSYVVKTYTFRRVPHQPQ